MELHVVGAQYYGNAFDRRPAEKTATLIREPSNPHDANAVAVHVGGVKRGHLSRARAAAVAETLDVIGAVEVPLLWNGPGSASVVWPANPEDYVVRPSRYPHLGIAYLVWFLTGILGGHHYYLKRWGWGVAYTLTAGFVGIGWVVDAFRLPRLVNG